MIPGVDTLLSQLPPYQDEWVVVKEKQSVKDIIKEILDAHEEFAGFYDSIALYFDADSTKEICKNIYSFLKKNIAYHEEKEEDQTTALPSGLLTRGFGDCKHYASFSGGILNALNRLTGAGIKWNYRFASYNVFNKIPHHVFVVVQDPESRQEIWIDPTPGAGAEDPVWLIDKKINVSTMALRRNIAGIGYAQSDVIYTSDRLPVLANEELAPELIDIIEERQTDEEMTPDLEDAINLLLRYNVMNAEGEISDKVMKALSTSLPLDEFEAVANARQLITYYITNAIAADGGQMGNIFSKLWSAVKKVTLALPRNAYLSMVALNVFGWATKLHNAVYKSDGNFFQPNQQMLADKWTKLGGNWRNLNNAINSGNKKKAILGTTAVGVAAAAIPAWVALASGILAAIAPLLKQMLAAKQQAGQLDSGIDPATGLPYGLNGGNEYGTQGNGFNPIEWIKANPLIALGIGGGAYLLFFDKKKPAAAAGFADLTTKQKGMIVVGAGAAYLLYTKFVKGKTEGDTTTETLDLDHQYFNQLSQVLEADDVFKSNEFPANFYEYVQGDLTRIKAGQPRDPAYNYGLPGAFMSVADAWKDAMGYSDATHAALWHIYGEYQNALTKSKF